jgi:hypothetical protein
MSVALTLSRVYKSLADYAASTDRTSGVPTAGIPARRTANAREDEADCPLTDRAPVVLLADFIFFNLRGVAAENPRLSALVESLRKAQYKGYDREHCGRELDALAERWGCAPDRLLAEAMAAVAGCFDAGMLRESVGSVRDRIEELTGKPPLVVDRDPTLDALRAALLMAPVDGTDDLDADIQRREAELEALKRARAMRENRKRARDELALELENLAAVATSSGFQ